MPSAAQRLRPNLHLASVVDRRYEIVETIAEGGMSVVYQAYDRQLEREVALKFVLPELGDVGQARLRHEARVMATICHPNVLPIYDIGFFNHLPYLVLPYVHGNDLQEWVSMRRGRAVDPAEAVRLLDKICQGVIALHDAGIVHHDIKPENILISATNEVIVADLGLARFSIHGELGTPNKGTPGYIAPENVAQPPDLPFRYAPAADVYALGITAFWLLAGGHPFDTGDPGTTVRRQLSEELPPLSEYAPHLPRAFEDALRSSTHIDPQRRCSVRELQTALRAAECLRQASLSPDQVPRVVVVDEDPSTLVSIGAVVETALPNAQVVCFSRSTDALAEIMTRRPSAVIMDVDMPCLGDTTLLQAIRTRRETKDTPIVVTTGVGSGSDWRKLRQVGATKFLVKPLDNDVLHDVIRRLHA